MSLHGKVAVVTGGTGALGKVVVRRLLEEGAYAISTYRSEQDLSALMDELGDSSKLLTGLRTDVTNEKSVQELFQTAVEKHGRIDILLNIVGGYKGGAEISNTQERDWDFMMNINLKSAFLCSKAALPYMIRQNYGKIVSVSSRTAMEKRFRNKNGAYAISKAGVVILTEVIADEVKKSEINVNCILPSTIDTPDNRRNMPDADFSKWVKPEEIAEVIIFLVSDKSKVTSGAVVPVYGKA